jgi:hypothetical protein
VATTITLQERLAHAQRSLAFMREWYTQEECLRMNVTPTIAELEAAVAQFGAALEWDATHAEYVGNATNGVSYRASPTPVGWYLTAVVDSDSSGVTCDLVRGEGPFTSETEALLCGYDLATSWCRDNRVPFSGFGPDAQDVADDSASG